MEERVVSGELMEEVAEKIWADINANYYGGDSEELGKKIENALKIQNAIIEDKKVEYDFSERYNTRLQNKENAERDALLKAESNKNERFNNIANWAIGIGGMILTFGLGVSKDRMMKKALRYQFMEHGAITDPFLKNWLSRGTDKLSK